MKELVRKQVQIDFGTLSGVIPECPRAVPMDIDGALEINGSFLFLETKFDKDAVSIGQTRFFQALSKKLDFTVIYVHIEKKESSAKGVFHFLPLEIKLIIDGEVDEWRPCNLKQFINIYRGWYKMAKGE